MALVQSGAYSFIDVTATMDGPGGKFDISGSGVSEEAIRVSMTNDKNTMVIGARGDGMHSLRVSTAARITISLLKTANGNAQMNALYRYQSVPGAAFWGQNTLTIINAISGDAIIATAGAFVRQTDVVYAVEGGLNSWVFDFTATELILGNNYRAKGL